MKCQNISDLGAYRARYNYIAYLSRRDWAYEYLRRVPAFEVAAWKAQESALSRMTACHRISLLKMRRPQPEAEAWGLKFFPNPAVHAPKAKVFWNDLAHSEKVHVNVVDRKSDEPNRIFDQTIAKCRIEHLVDWEKREHLIVRGKGCSIQVRCHGLSLLRTAPVKMSFDVDDLEEIDRYARILEQSKLVFGDHVASPPEFTRKAALMRNGLIALDGRRAGLTDRQIASIIEGTETVEAGVAKGDRSLIRRVRTYRDKAYALCEGGFRDLLAPRSTLARPA